MKSEPTPAVNKIFAPAFGLFLGLCIWKFGDPVILDQKIFPPTSASEFWTDAWPTHWAGWIFLPFFVAGIFLILKGPWRRPSGKWLWLLPLGWLGWQFVSATQSVDADLTAATLWQFFGCVACYFIGVFFFNNRPALNLLLIGVLAAFIFCLVRAIDQRLVEFPQSRRVLLEGQRDGWTNLPPAVLLEMEREEVIITTNGMEVANPAVLARFGKPPPTGLTGLHLALYKLFAPAPRVIGTLVYPNALAGIVLLLGPVSLMLAIGAKNLRPAIHGVAVAMIALLGGAGLFWSGSKLGWLLAMGVGGLYLLRLDWPTKLKIAAIVTVAVLGLAIFAVRFHHYFANGATSVGARFDYWRAAIRTTVERPIFGTGPGTFQRPYARLKSPDAEMARLAHNDYLEQFSDSGICGGIIYLSWILLAVTTLGRRAWRSNDKFAFAIFAGLLAWFIQGFAEFSLYIPALAWTAFTLLGSQVAMGSARAPGAVSRAARGTLGDRGAVKVRPKSN